MAKLWFEGLILEVRNWKTQFVSISTAIPEGLFELFHLHSAGILLKNDSSGNGSFDWMCGMGSIEQFSGKAEATVFEEFQNFLSLHTDWAFGHFSYDLKNAIEKLQSKNQGGMAFQELDFFIPEQIIIQQKELRKFSFTNENDERLFSQLAQTNFHSKVIASEIHLKARTSKEEYLSNVNCILQHIHRGDIYELNYCIEFFAEQVSIDPVLVFQKLIELTDAPFSVLYKRDQQWLLCGSPERFLRKKGNSLLSQPIKGTRPRGKSTSEDEHLKNELRNDEKEKSENVMIVDLVRNDLSKSAKKGSVKVDELFGIHSFKSVHQMISSVSAELSENTSPVEAIKNAFPMGSMTGAPKIRAMELAEHFEQMKRGLYSGAVGYFTPEMDFDFNVVIRSIQYNAETGYLSLMVGSAITANSVPEKEYQECLLKAETLFKALGIQPKE